MWGLFDGVMIYLNSEIPEKSLIHPILLQCFFFAWKSLRAWKPFFVALLGFFTGKVGFSRLFFSEFWAFFTRVFFFHGHFFGFFSRARKSGFTCKIVKFDGGIYDFFSRIKKFFTCVICQKNHGQKIIFTCNFEGFFKFFHRRNFISRSKIKDLFTGKILRFTQKKHCVEPKFLNH